MWSELEAGDMTLYIDVEPGAHTIGVAPTGTTNAQAEITVQAQQRGKYTVFLLANDSGSPEMQVIQDDNTPLEEGAKLRYIHFFEGPDVDVVVEGETFKNIASDLTQGTVSSYSTVPAGSYELRAIQSGTFPENVMGINRIEVQDGDVVTLFGVEKSANANAYAIYLPTIEIGGAAGSRLQSAAVPEWFHPVAEQSDVEVRSSPLVDYSHPTYIRLVNAATDQSALDFMVYELPLVTNVSPISATDYVQVPPGVIGTLTYGVRVTGSNANLFTVNVDAQRDTYYTLVALPDGEYTLLKDDLSIPELGMTNLRVVNNAPSLPASLDVVAVQDGKGTVVVRNIGAEDEPHYTSIKGGVYDIEIRPAGRASVITRQTGVNLREGNQYSIHIIGTGADALVTLDLDTWMEVQETYYVEQAAAGTWNVVLDGVPPEEDNYILSVQGFNPPPEITQVHGEQVAGAENTAEVTWRATSDDPAMVNFYATTGPIEQTDTITNDDGTTETHTFPIYKGELLAGDVSGALDGSLQTTQLKLDNVPSGTYYLWMEVNDGRDKEVRSYVRTPDVMMSAASLNVIGETDADNEGHSRLAAESLFTMIVDNTAGVVNHLEC